MNPIIEIRGLAKRFRAGNVYVESLRRIDLKVFSGEFLIIHGPSGSGKTTLLNMIAGLERSSAGSIVVRDKSLKSMSDEELARYRRSSIGMVFQNFNLIPSLTALENVTIPLQLSGVSVKERNKRGRELLREVGLQERSNHFPGALSGGEQQRVAIARSLATNPWILLVDEPTGNLDTVSGEEIIRILKELNKKYNRTIILVTHNDKYLEYATRVAYLQDGIIVAEKSIQEIKEAEESNLFKYYIPPKLKRRMCLKDIIGLSYRHFRFARTRTFLTTLGMTIGVAAIVLFVSLGFGLQKITVSSLATVKDLETLTVTPAESDPTGLDDEIVANIVQLEGVDLVSPAISLTARGELAGTSTDVVVKALKPEYLSFEQVEVSTGDAFSGDSAPETIVSLTALKGFDIDDPSNAIGKKLKLKIFFEDKNSNVQNYIVEPVVVGVSNEDVVPHIFLPLGYLRQEKLNGYSSLAVRVDTPSKIEALKKEIEGMGLEVAAISGLIKQINKTFLIVEVILGLIGGIALLVASFGIVNTMTISLLERTHEIGIMRALGIATRDIKRLFTYEACLFGLFGGVSGVLFGWLMGWGINSILAVVMRRAGNAETLELFVTPYKFAIIILLFALIMSRLAGVYPTWSATRRSPLEALRYE